MQEVKNIMVIAAHPDDEILGCGAIMAMYSEKGHRLQTLIAAEGVTSRDSKRLIDKEKQSELDLLKKTAQDANREVGVKEVEFLGLPDNRMDSLELLDVVKLISEKINKFNPDIIFTHFPHDLNIDHRIVAEAVLTATRPQPNEKVKEIYFFEVPSSTEWRFTGTSDTAFAPNTFFNVEKFLNKKLNALKIYKSEMRDFPHSRSIENLEYLAKYRGASVGYQAAEAFVLARSLRD